jgi:hypothetical protein
LLPTFIAAARFSIHASLIAIKPPVYYRSHFVSRRMARHGH